MLALVGLGVGVPAARKGMCEVSVGFAGVTGRLGVGPFDGFAGVTGTLGVGPFVGFDGVTGTLTKTLFRLKSCLGGSLFETHS